MPLLCRLVLILFAVVPPVSAGDAYVWWEGEQPAETNFPKQTWFSSSSFKDNAGKLSGGQWLTNIGNRKDKAAFAKYTITVPVNGMYHFWVRKFWKHGPFEWRFDNQAWKTCGRDVALADSTPLMKHTVANWVSLGTVQLTAGKRQFELRLTANSGESLTCGFDCFILSRQPFHPRGKLKPGEKSGLADPGHFAWEPDPDPYAKDAALDLRGLNEPEAGVSGFVTRKDGKFMLGSGKPVRFWGVNAGPGIAGLDDASLDNLARMLAKRGVNIIRFHGPIFDARDPMKADPVKIQHVQRLVHAMKKQGIYSKLSFYFPVWFGVKPHYGITGYDKNGSQKPFGLLFFHPRMQQFHQAWLRALLTSPNPAGGKPFASDPAIAMVEILNEDSFFFWTFARKNLPEPHWGTLEKQFGAWLTKRHGSVAGAQKAWKHTDRRDDAAGGRAALFDAWHMTRDGLAKSRIPRARISDQVRFLAEMQRAYYIRTREFIRKELKCGSLISASNWHVSDPEILDAIERYTYTATDVLDQHGYFGGEHKGEGSSYSVRVSHTYRDRKAVMSPEALPIRFIHYADHPHIISEIGWTQPNRFRADYAFLAAAYGSLQNADGIFAFALGGAGWDQSMNKFPASSPAILGNFPAHALLYRRGDVNTPPPVVEQTLSLEDLYALKGSGGFTAQALDALRQKDIPAGAQATGRISAIDPLAYYTGPVHRQFGTQPEQSRQVNLASWIHREAGIVTSRNQELRWDYKNGVVQMNSARAQGIAGNLKNAGNVKLKDVTLELDNTYGTCTVITLDGKPIADSTRILVQTMTAEQPYGFKTNGDAPKTITNLGGAPFGVENIRGRITLHSGRFRTIHRLDLNGYRDRALKAQSTGNRTTVELPADGVYVLIER